MPRQTIIPPVRHTPSTRTGRDWRHDAACRDVDPELFFPVGDQGPAVARQVAEAKAICRQCPVKARCLMTALATGEDAGVWGNATEAERRHLAGREHSLQLQGVDQ